jgi:hypothetical protein
LLQPIALSLPGNGHPIAPETQYRIATRKFRSGRSNEILYHRNRVRNAVGSASQTQHFDGNCADETMGAEPAYAEMIRPHTYKGRRTYVGARCL